MIKKFIALSLAVLVMASHMVSPYALTIYSTDNWTENGVTGKIYPNSNNPNYQTYYASTTANRRYNFISVNISLVNAETTGLIKEDAASGSNLDYVDVYAHATYGYFHYVNVKGISQVGSSKDNITTEFGVRKLYIQ